MRRLVSSGSPLEGPIGFSRACRVGDHIAVAGTAPIEDGETVFAGDLYRQARHCLKLAILSIEEAGGKVADVLRTRMLLTDVSRWEEAARAHGEVFGTIRPACTFVEVSGFIGADWMVEVEMDCVVS